MGSKSSNTESCARDSLSKRTSQTGLLANNLSLSLKEVKFCDQEFAADIPIFYIKCNHLGFEDNNIFYPFHD